MLVLQIVRAAGREFRRLPILARIGLAVMLLAFMADVVVHMSTVAHVHSTGFDPQEHLAHLAGILGMVLVLAGVVIDGTLGHRPRRRRSHANR